MAAPEFVFAIEISGPLPSSRMLRDLASHVLGHAGCPTADVPAIVEALHAAVAGSASGGTVSCGVRFRAHAGEVVIDVESKGARIWGACHRMA